MDMNDVPLLRIPGSENYWSGYETGLKWDAAFPRQDADELAYAIEYNGQPDETIGQEMRSVVCLKAGYHDGDDWIWVIVLGDNTVWVAQGGCDYTGWDCQSNLDWKKVWPNEG